MLSRFMVVVLMLVPGIVFAGGQSGANVLGEFEMRGNGYLELATDAGDWNNPDACNSSTYVYIHKDNVFFNQLFAMSLARKMELKPISFFLNGCVDIFGTTYPIAVTALIP